VLRDGDIVNVDVTAFLGGFHGDLNETFLVGEGVDEAGRTLVRAAHDALAKAIEAVRPGVRFRDIGDIISKHVHQHGLSVVKTYCGHGIGDLFHCAPSIPHYTHNKAVGVMKEGQVRALLSVHVGGGGPATTDRPVDRSIDPPIGRSVFFLKSHSIDRSCRFFVSTLPHTKPHALNFQNYAGLHDRADDQRRQLARRHVARRLDGSDLGR